MKAKIFALTGGIGTGKSTISSAIKNLGVPIVDADRIARKVVERGSEGYYQVLLAFGERVVDSDGFINRAELGRIVFSDKSALIELNSILHPKINELANIHFRMLSNTYDLICYDIPLLFETEQQNKYRPIVLVTCSEEEQLQRVMMRDRLSEDDAIARISSQIPMAKKTIGSDFVVVNSNGADARTLATRILEYVKRSV